MSESFLAASRMIPGDYDSWHKEWMVVADNNMRRGEAEEGNRPADGHGCADHGGGQPREIILAFGKAPR